MAYESWLFHFDWTFFYLITVLIGDDFPLDWDLLDEVSTRGFVIFLTLCISCYLVLHVQFIDYNALTFFKAFPSPLNFPSIKITAFLRAILFSFSPSLMFELQIGQKPLIFLVFKSITEMEPLTLGNEKVDNQKMTCKWECRELTGFCIRRWREKNILLARKIFLLYFFREYTKCFQD